MYSLLYRANYQWLYLWRPAPLQIYVSFSVIIVIVTRTATIRWVKLTIGVICTCEVVFQVPAIVFEKRMQRGQLTLHAVQVLSPATNCRSGSWLASATFWTLLQELGKPLDTRDAYARVLCCVHKQCMPVYSAHMCTIDVSTVYNHIMYSVLLKRCGLDVLWAEMGCGQFVHEVVKKNLIGNST